MRGGCLTSLGINPMELVLWNLGGGGIKCLLGDFHQSAANIRVIQDDHWCPRVMV